MPGRLRCEGKCDAADSADCHDDQRRQFPHDQEQEADKRRFRQYINKGEVNPCIMVDDIIRSGNAIEETDALVRELGAPVIGCGAIVRFTSATDKLGAVPIRSLVEFDAHMYDEGDECSDCKKDVPVEHVRF